MTVEGKKIEKQKIPVGTWSSEKRFEKFDNYTFRKPKPFYRVGKAHDKTNRIIINGL